MKENSIEEDIKMLEELRIANENCIKNAKIKDNPFVAIWEKQNRAIEHVLSDYKRVLKENEELKQDRNNNYQMIALAQNEVLGYMQGYEDGKKLKRSAVECVVENQKYYIIKKEIEHYKEHIVKLQKENEELEEINNELEAEKNEAIRRYNFESIPVSLVEEKIEELNKKEQKLQNSISAEEREEYSDANISWDLMDINIKREVLQELIEESE